MQKWMAVFFLAFFLVLGRSVPSFAVVASPSDAQPRDPEVLVDEFDDVPLATGSNAFVNDFMSSNWNKQFFSSGESNVINTISYKDVYLKLAYSLNNSFYERVFTFDDSGYVSVPVDAFRYDSIQGVYFLFRSGSLPNTGKYNMSLQFRSNTGGMTFDTCSFNSWYTPKNSSTQSQGVGIDFTAFSGDLDTSVSVDMGHIDGLQINFRSKGESGLELPYGGHLYVNFTKLGSGSSTSINTPNAGVDMSGSQIVDNTGVMVEQQETIIEQIVNVTQTISSQLKSFWDQLAGEFTNLFTKLTQNHTEQLENDNQNTQDIISNQDSNTTEITNNVTQNIDKQITNDNANTDKITNGYDNSGINSANDSLNNSMNEYTNQEDQIIDQISQPLNEFDFDNPITQYLSTFQLFGNFLQDLFTSSGSFKDVINLSFIMGIALMVAGLYRFKGGN